MRVPPPQTPPIVSGQVLLKPLLEMGVRDWQLFYRYFRDKEIAMLNGSSPIYMPLWLFKRVVTGEERGGERRGFGIYTASGQFIGSVELYDLEPVKAPRSGELGILIGEKTMWNLGYGTDAMHGILEFGFGKLKLERLRLKTLEHNARARRAFEKVGFVFERISLETRHYNFAHYRLERSVWLERQGKVL
jgi:RimJ/RimL family protein N-acetyltransferase